MPVKLIAQKELDNEESTFYNVCRIIIITATVNDHRVINS